MQRHGGHSLDAIGALLKADIEARGWLPIDLARRCDVSHMTVGRYISGERRTPRMAKRFAKALNQPVRRYLPSNSVTDEERRHAERRDGDRRTADRREVEA